jgi:mRNA interferase MazF
MPGNVFLPSALSRLPRDSVVNVTAVVTLDKSELSEGVSVLPMALMHEIGRGLRGSLQL